jgi:hypothetical protein
MSDMKDRDVRIVFTASKTWFGKLVRWITRSKVSHVFIEFPVWDRRMVGESTVGGTRMVLAEKARHDVVAEFRIYADAEPGLIELAKRLGSAYDYGGLFVILWFKMLWQLFRHRTRSPRWSSKAQKCSELIANVLDAMKLQKPSGWSTELVTPKDVMKYCMDAPEIKLLEGDANEVARLSLGKR